MNIKNVEDNIKQCYSTWGATYFDDYYGVKAPYPPVHRDIIKNLLRDARVTNVLDAGCGSASLLRNFVDLDIDLYGFDLTPEMLAEGKNVFSKLGLDSNHLWRGNVIDFKSFRQPNGKSLLFDAVICSGVLPHILDEYDSAVIQNLHDAVKPGGLVILEARNQFFSLFTLNRYSYQFFIQDLIRLENLKLYAGKSAVQLEIAIEKMRSHFTIDHPLIRKGNGDKLGYDEVLSRTHNPLILKEQFKKAGFKDVQLLFYHFHCLPPLMASELPEFFMRESIAMENPHDWRGFFMASAFILSGKRNDYSEEKCTQSNVIIRDGNIYGMG